jgi:hypothetical protein
LPCPFGRFRSPSPRARTRGSCSLERCRRLRTRACDGTVLHRPPAVSRLRPRTLRSAAHAARAPSMGFRRSLFATSAGDVHWLSRAPSSTLTVHPRRFARPRWFSPSPALRACFIPLPRTGFPYRGLSLDSSRTGFLRPLPSFRSARFRLRHTFRCSAPPDARADSGPCSRVECGDWSKPVKVRPSRAPHGFSSSGCLACRRSGRFRVRDVLVVDRCEPAAIRPRRVERLLAVRRGITPPTRSRFPA